jgi:hypothetical protein
LFFPYDVAMQVIQTIHGHSKWIVAAIALVLVVKFLLGLIQKGKPQNLDLTLARVFAIVMTLQFVMGVINLVAKLTGVSGAMYRQAWEHAFTGTIIVGLSHMVGPMLRKRGYLVALIMGVVALALTYINVLTIGRGWQ